MHASVRDAINSAHDPLQFDIIGQSHALLLKIGEYIQNAQTRLVIEGLLAQTPSATVSQALDAVSELMATPAFTLIVADLFRPLVIDLCARWIDNNRLDDVDRFVALCLLVEPHEEIFPVLDTYLSSKALENGPLAFIAQPGIALADVPAAHLQRILLAYYRLLAADPAAPTRLSWPSYLLQSIYRPSSGDIAGPHPDPAVRWLALRCFGFQTCLSEADREKLETEYVGVYAVDHLPLRIGQELKQDPATGSALIKDVVVDAWFFPLVELKRIQTKRDELATQPTRAFVESSHPALRIVEADLHPRILNISGVLLYSQTPTSDRHGLAEYVSTTTTTNTLRALALHVSQRIPTLLTATPASGKMTLIRELASRVHPEGERGLVILQLADTALDAKSLIGSYVSASTSEKSAGGFVWQDGAVPRALRAGKWLVLADVDRASTEVLATLLPMVESMRPGKHIGELASLDLGGGRGRVQGRPTFMIFGLRSVTKVRPDQPVVYPPPVFFGHKHWFEVQLIPPSIDELVMIVERRFPRLGSSVSRTVVEFWQQMGTAARTLPKPRDVGMRDLEKFCVRLEKSLPPAAQGASFSCSFPNHIIREEILLEARDVFFSAYEASSPHFACLSTRAMQLLELDSDRANSALAKRAPEYVVRKSGEVVVGRSQLSPKYAPTSSEARISKPFAIHRPALTLLESISVAVSTRESILLVGETGTGKTTSVQHAAELTRTPLVVLNLSNQSEASDLLGGFKPIDARVPAGRLQGTFMELFGAAFSRKKNKKFEDAVRTAYIGGKWARVVKLWREAGKLAGVDGLRAPTEGTGEGEQDQTEGPRKRRKVGLEWDAFIHEVDEFDAAHVKGQSKFVFSFVEGPLVNALRNGHWVLLDEVNLASAETLECIASILQSPHGSVTLTEAGHLEPIPRHPDFRLFACMNPATDAGKKDLPPNIRSRFTEIYVPPPDADEDALRNMVAQYIGNCALADKTAITNVADFYIAAKRLTTARQLADGQNHVPHFSMRTLARALTFASDLTPTLGLRRALWEGITMAFMMTLDTKSAETLRSAAEKHILGNVKNVSALFNQPVAPPEKDASKYVQVGSFWLLRGPEPIQPADEYVLTPSVEAKLIDLARIVTTRRFPVLIEGPTSSGKTSSVEYLAKQTGHRFVRINNHEHTDLQEYLGSYLTDPTTGKLKFQDGILVRALRAGDWIVLDELNLAPTDVLEALNRLLDDNRELIVPETNELIRPHPNFMLFATQNPPGLYAGRKVLSRAFRNRFLEVHFNDVPQDELETILCQRCGIAQSHGRKIVSVFQELQKRRQVGRVFETKNSFATLRDLFRWANRHSKGYDEYSAGGNYQHLAEQGFMLLAERARRADDRAVVKSVIEDIMKVKIDEQGLYDLSRQRLGAATPIKSNIVWTSAMRRLYTLVATSLRYNEPVLLVGETGSGKTSVCELFAAATGKSLYSLSCHQNTETADLLGSQRPLRNRTALINAALGDATNILHTLGYLSSDETPGSLDRAIQLVESAVKGCSAEYSKPLGQTLTSLHHASSLFEWHDGPLIQAMRKDGLFLLDEISLADDSVLERLNSVLEPARTVVLAEKGGSDISQLTVVATPNFQLAATMNPGGDYGKKELSPALRNRFTEIWVPHISDREDLQQIIDSSWADEQLRAYTAKVLDFSEYAGQVLKDSHALGLRDLLAWVQFSNFCASNTSVSPSIVFHHAARLTVLDGFASLGSIAMLSSYETRKIGQALEQKLHELVVLSPTDAESFKALEVGVFGSRLSIGPFSIALGELVPTTSSFSLQAPTTLMNAARVIRALQIPKPLLLEGSPGVGKTSLIVALAAMAGHSLCRINLSDQTDLIDLFGSDMPVEGGNPGEFAWKDAAFLRAMQNGDWVLLDEMNLAPQAVLEGLNAVLDHRGTVFIPELGRGFTKHPGFRVFAAQNPLAQGGGRKGLPKSFVNRFTKVYVEALSREDLQVICRVVEPGIPEETLREMLTYNERLCEEVVERCRFGREGSPWEFNLRDILRWISLCKSPGLPRSRSPAEYLDDIYISRFRSDNDRQSARALYGTTSRPQTKSRKPIALGLNEIQLGHTFSARHSSRSSTPSLALLDSQSVELEVASKCISSGWLLILSGPGSSGKSSLVRTLAAVQGTSLREVCMNPGADTSDLLGGFEHSSRQLKLRKLVAQIYEILNSTLSITPSLDAILNSITKSLDKPSTCEPDLDRERLREICTHLEAASGDGYMDVALSIRKFLNEDSSAGRFEWVDGPLIQAMRDGAWLVLDHCNLCSPAVLDRLNSLCENGGVLVLSERGNVTGDIPVVVPHPNFRLFMLLDPRHGELSRAMRNRGLEVSLPPVDLPADKSRIRVCARLPKSPTQSFLTEDTAIAQLSRRGLFAPSISMCYSVQSPSPILGNLALAVSDHRAFASVQVLSSIQQRITTTRHWISSILFLITSMPRESLRGVIRQLSALDYNPSFHSWNAILDHCLLKTCDDLNTLTGNQRGIPPRFVSSQPVLLHMNPNIMSASIDPELFHEYLVLESAWEAVVRIQYGSNVKPLAHPPPVGQLSILEKSQLIWGGVGAGIVAPHCVRSIAPLISALRKTCGLVLGSSQAVSKQSNIDAVQALLDCADILHAISETHFVDYAAIRSLVQLACETFNHPDFPRDQSKEACEIANNLIKDTAINSGEAMLQIWTTMQLPSMAEKAQAIISHLFASLVRQQDADIREKALDIAAMLYMNDNDELIRCASKLASLEYIPVSERDLHISNLDHQEFYISSMEIIANAIEGVLSKRLRKSFLSAAMLIPKHDWAFLTHLRMLVWEGESSNEEKAHLLEPSFKLPTLVHKSQAFFAAHMGWMRVGWLAQGVCLGPELLLKSVEHSACHQRNAIASVNLGQNQQYKTSLQTQSAQLKLQAYSQNTDRLVSLVILWFHSTSLIFASFASETTEEERTYINDLQIQLSPVADRHHVCRIAADLAKFMSNCSVPLLARVAKKQLSGLQEFSIAPRASEYDLAVFLGRAWIGISHMLIELYFPEIPMDPLGARNCQNLIWSSRLEWLNAHITTLESAQALIQNLDYELTIGRLQDRVSIAQSRCEELRTSTVRGPEHLQHLTEMFTEVHSFLNQAISPARISLLVSSLESDPQPRDFSQEEMIQETISTFLQRLVSNFPDIADIVYPVEYALRQLKVGLRMHVSAAQHRPATRTTISNVTSLLLKRPTFLGLQLLLESDLTSLTAAVPLAVTAADWMLAKCRAVLLSNEVDHTPRLPLHHLSELYEHILNLWLSQKARDARTEEESQSLYRRRNTDSTGLSQEEELEREFEELFPSFTDILDGSSVDPFPRTPVIRSTGFVSEANIRAVCQIHSAWASFDSGSRNDSSRLYSSYEQNSIQLTSQIIQNYGDSLDASIDNEGFHQRVRVTQKSLKSLGSQENSSFDFYHNANLSEITKAARLLDSLRDRLNILINEWPDQMVLRHIYQRCQVVSQFRLDTPIAKILSALEQLLLHTDDWETYANKDNTLKLQQQQLVDLIVEWRRLELKCWSTLLDREMTSCTDAVSMWWPQLYESIVSAVGSMGDDHSKMTSHLGQLVPLLDSYLQQSPLGQFETRLSLLQSFTKLSRSLSLESPTPHNFLAMSNLLETLCLQYLQMLPSVQSSLSVQRNSVDKEVNDFIKLASWKDTNVHALKQSAQRTHRVLHKCIRKFRSIVRQPVSDILTSEYSTSLSAQGEAPNSNMDSQTKSMIPLAWPEIALSSPLRNINIKLAFQKYQLHAAQSGRRLIRNSGIEVVQILVARITTGSRELAEVTVTESEARERQIKALISQKRRAWSDLLKELKRLGLSSAVTTETLEQQADRARLLLLALHLDDKSSLYDSVLAANKHFVKLLEIMPSMRESFRRHHPDISTHDFRRASNLVESSFSLVIESRRNLELSLFAYNKVRIQLSRMADIQEQLAEGGSIIAVGKPFSHSAEYIRATVGRLRFTLSQLLDDIATLEEVVPDINVPSTTKDSIKTHISKGADILDRMVALEGRVIALGTSIWTAAEATIYHEARSHISAVKVTFELFASDPANPARLFEPIRTWIKCIDLPEEQRSVSEGTTESSLLADEIISKLLIGMQAVVAKANDLPQDESDDEFPDKSIRAGAHHVQRVASVIGIEDIAQSVEELTSNMTVMNVDQIRYSVDCLVPFLESYLALVHDSLSEALRWLNSTSRLTYVLASTVRTLMQKGFCKPPDIQEESQGKEGEQELVEGTGVGEGAGAENVSNQVEDEAQVEGLQGDQESGGDGDRNDDDKDAIEMSEDFAGATEDVDQSGDEQDNSSKSETEADPEDRIEDLDSSNPNVVDEKLWNDESASEKPEGQDQAGDDSTTQPGETSETAAKEDKPQKSTERGKDKDRGDEKDGSGSETASIVDEQGMEEDDRSEAQDGRHLDDFVPEANTLDLPDDLDLGPNDDAADSERSQDTLDDQDQDVTMEDGSLTDNQNDRELEQERSASPEPNVENDTTPTDEQETTADIDTNISKAETQQADSGLGGQDTSSGVQGTETTAGEDHGEQQPGSSHADRSQNAGAQTENGAEKDLSPETVLDQATEPHAPDDTLAGATGSTAQADGTSQQQNRDLSDDDVPNPLRNPGDASKEIQRRVDQILSRYNQSEPTGRTSQNEQPGEVEYAHDDDAEMDMQVLGPSNDAEEATKLRDLRISDIPSAPLEEASPDMDMEVDAPPAPANETKESKAQAELLAGALTAGEVQRSRVSESDKDTILHQRDEETVREQDPTSQPTPQVDSDSLEVVVADWQAQGHPAEDAEEIWRLYESLTQDLSHNLCEQLRLILSPTRATRLRGDFRTGKRLNMKKLVPYVASDFTRDKIWLRRTRPAAREYQILLAVDDSRSMARASHTIHLTRQALALVARALEKLEVGELALARFGREVEVVHEFGAGILRGGAVLSKFGFNQPATDVLHLIESSLAVLRSARERNSGPSDLWQLEIVISDGICQDHERLRTVLRRAEEERVMIVFVVVDAPAQNGSEENSIVSMLQPTIKTVDGRMDIQMERYLDSFPFRYFVVLRNVEALPDVLAGTLRQFFERISED
ncbi:AAA domain protein [Ceratobasidium sp. AG-Ba]|nr:AAA domain protein [Ceratobasidium sp. AG-Ba]QRW15031.1 AAA domain protein [Ceratobasidium sp. AG-Ba]